MKKFIFILVAVFATTFSSYSQITTSTAYIKPNEPKNVTYDVTKNFLGTENVTSYIGQVLYVNGKSEQLQKWGYEYFKTTKVKHYDSNHRYGNPSVESQYRTKYEDLFGKYFKVLNVDKNETGEEYYIFTLQNRDNKNDIVYFNYNGKYEHTFPFIVVSHFEWLKNNLINKKYHLTYNVKNDKFFGRYAADKDFITGNDISHNMDDIWECIDITIEDRYHTLVMLLKNQNGNIITYDTQYLHNSIDGEVTILTDDDYQKLITKYGKAMVNAMREHVIRIGMSKELLIMSWGKPKEINYNSYGADQWVYGYSQYVYVNDNKIEGWN